MAIVPSGSASRSSIVSTEVAKPIVASSRFDAYEARIGRTGRDRHTDARSNVMLRDMAEAQEPQAACLRFEISPSQPRKLCRRACLVLTTSFTRMRWCEFVLQPFRCFHLKGMWIRAKDFS